MKLRDFFVANYKRFSVYKSQNVYILRQNFFYHFKMSAKEMLDQMKMIQNNLLKFIDEENDIEEHFQNIKEIFEDHQILDKYLVLVIHLIAQISNNHHQCSNFISKIERILLIFKEEMKNRFVNSALFYFFKNNKRILLFLIKEGIMTIDKYIFFRNDENKIQINEISALFFTRNQTIYFYRYTKKSN